MISARTADIKRMGVTYIHNKGALVDGNKTLISSINWDNNAVMNNREAAVLLVSSTVYNHYETLFNNDWQVSAGASGHPVVTSTFAPSREDTSHGLGTQSDTCPSRVHLAVSIGDLVSTDPEDTSFNTLARTHFSGEIVRVAGAHTCMLTDTRSVSRTGKSRVVEIRKRADGTRSAVLEGYTNDGAVYSIRTTLDVSGPYDGAYNASVYNGSGPSRERLGDAVLEIRTDDPR
jgi:hypothetical protein